MAINILEYISTQCKFTENSLILPSNEHTQIIHRFMRVAVLDAHLPVVKPVGFALNASSKFHKQSPTERCSYCLENMIEIASNLKSVIFLNVHNKRVSTGYETGEVSFDTVDFKSNGKAVKAVYTNDHVMTCIKPLSIEIYVNENTGYRDMSDNSKIIANDKFFPLNTYHNIIDYMRILPYNGEVKYKLDKKIKVEEVQDLFFKYYTNFLAGVLSKEENEWVLSYNL